MATVFSNDEAFASKNNYSNTSTFLYHFFVFKGQLV